MTRCARVWASATNSRELSYKPYPCCRFNHTGIDAALALRESAGVSAERVRRIRVGVNRQAYEAVATPIEVRKAPHTIVHAQFSLPFTVAAALVDGRVELSHFTDASIRREDILALAQRVDVFVDDDIEREWGRNISPADMQRRDERRHDAHACASTGRSVIRAGRCRPRTSTPRPSIAFVRRRLRLRDDRAARAAQARRHARVDATTCARSCAFFESASPDDGGSRPAKETK